MPLMLLTMCLYSHIQEHEIKELQLHMAAGTATVVKMLIKYQHILWTVSQYKVACKMGGLRNPEIPVYTH